MIAAIVDVSTLMKVILYALISGVGISAVFALGVSAAAGMADAFRQRRTVAGALWGLTARRTPRRHSGALEARRHQSRRAPECRGYGRNPPPPPLLLPVAAVLGWVPSVTLTVIVLPERFTVRVTVSPGE